VAVARAGADATPTVPAPAALRPFLHFSRLPATALQAARRVLDADEAFRARVAEDVSEAEVGRAGWLFLDRPDGWEEDLDTLVRRSETDRAEAAERRAEHDARRRLAAVEAAARRAEEDAASARAEALRAGELLAEERRTRREAAQREADLAARADELATRLQALASERDRSRQEAAAAASEAVSARRRADRLAAELEAVRASTPPPAEQPSEAPPPGQERPKVGAWTAEARGPASGAPPAEVPAPPLLGPSPGEAATAVSAAAQAARGLADALAAAAEAMGGQAAPAPPDRSAETRPASAPGERAPLRVVEPRLRATAPRRSPAPLPPGILEDAPEAAEHLARLRGVVLLVDGYNVSHAAWPGTPIREQRRRLVDALGELAARTGADVRVVFDGSDTVEPPMVASTSKAVRVRFSPPDVEADDVLVDEVAALPVSRPVVVATSDRRLREGCRSQGANVIRSSQLLGLLHLRQ
jgi:predicted RNA-binding protein with PIN domain